MATLKTRLDRIKGGAAERIPPATRAVMANATEDLRASGIAERIPAVGSLMPPFELPNSEGKIVRSTDLLERGPLVLSFYRGSW